MAGRYNFTETPKISFNQRQTGYGVGRVSSNRKNQLIKSWNPGLEFKLTCAKISNSKPSTTSVSMLPNGLIPRTGLIVQPSSEINWVTYTGCLEQISDAQNWSAETSAQLSFRSQIPRRISHSTSVGHLKIKWASLKITASTTILLITTVVQVKVFLLKSQNVQRYSAHLIFTEQIAFRPNRNCPTESNHMAEATTKSN